MSFIGWMIAIAVSGLLVGALARLALPGKDPMSLGQTMLVGIGGSLFSGLIAYALWGGAPSIVLSVLFASVIVYLVRRSRGGSLTSPGTPPERR